MAELYRAVWRVTGRQQLVLIGLSVLVAAVAVLPLKFQQLIVNTLVQAGDLPRLAWLCAGFVGAILISGALKFMRGLRLSIVGERVILLVRERLYTDHVPATSASADVPTRGTLVAMLASEAETVGAFAGGAIASPLVQLGTLTSVISFIFASQPRLGVLALAVVLPQAAIVVALQNRINQRMRERVQAVRDASDRISISALGKVGVLFLGGGRVLNSQSDVGIVVASLSGLQRIDGPWRDLVAFFRNASTVRVQYEMLVRAIAVRHPGADGSATAS